MLLMLLGLFCRELNALNTVKKKHITDKKNWSMPELWPRLESNELPLKF
jgi:hypothetical protein